LTETVSLYFTSKWGYFYHPGPHALQSARSFLLYSEWAIFHNNANFSCYL